MVFTSRAVAAAHDNKVMSLVFSLVFFGDLVTSKVYVLHLKVEIPVIFRRTM